MPCIINIETSTHVCSVALSYDGGVPFHVENFDGPSHASLLAPYVQQAIEAAKRFELTPDAIAVSCGPGSYTGLRIGVSTAKGLSFGMNLPLLGINTLQIMACAVMFKQSYAEGTLFCPMIDARRMEVYAAIYDSSLSEVKPTSADIIDEHSYEELLAEHSILFFGNGAEKCKGVLNHPNAHFVEGIDPLAVDMLALSEMAYRQQDFKEIAYFEPFYLKEFVATTPKKKIL